MSKPHDEIKDIHIAEIGMTLEELEQKTDESLRLLAAIKAIHKPYSRKYLPAHRAVAYAQGLVHSPEEFNALDATLITAEENPGNVQTLAKRDAGSEPNTFETTLIYARLEAVKRMQEVGEKTLALANLLLDTAASIGENAKPVVQAAYQILKPVADIDEQVQTSLEPAITYHKAKASNRQKK
jgi:hypothetical protein